MIIRCHDAQSVAEAAVTRFVDAGLDARHERGRFVVALAGGTTPALLYRLLRAGPWRLRVPWSVTHILFGDERCVPPDHERSNYRMAFENLLDHVRIPQHQVHRMRGELAEPEEAATTYEATLRQLFPGAELPRIDLLLLGIGTDGHTASLFPGSRALEEDRRWVVAAREPNTGGRRLTMTLPVLCAARRILFLATGEEKSEVLAQAFGDRAHDGRYPCERVVPTHGRREVLIDRAAARLLTGSAEGESP